MSTSDLYRVYRTKATHFAKFRNGWGSAPLLWHYLSKNFLGGRDWMVAAADNTLWALVRDHRVDLRLRVALAFTCDQAICHQADVAR